MRENSYPSTAYDLLDDNERNIVDEYVKFVVEEQKKLKQRVDLALNKPFPDSYVKKSRGVLSRAVVKAAVAERVLEESKKDDISADRVLKELSKIAFSDITDYLYEGQYGELQVKDLAVIPKNVTCAIKSIETKPSKFGLTTKITMHDKIPALKELSEYLGMKPADKPPILQEYIKQEIHQVTKKEDEVLEEAKYEQFLQCMVGNA